jgi:8-amino-7-oxononanoate synthase
MVPATVGEGGVLEASFRGVTNCEVRSFAGQKLKSTKLATKLTTKIFKFQRRIAYVPSYKKTLDDLASRNLMRRLRLVRRISARECVVDGVSCVDFSSNNYLAISGHPALIEESCAWTRKLGAGSGASRLITGTLAEYVELEERIADWKGSEAALIVGSGYLANTGAIPALAPRKSAIFADRLNHSSLNAGAALSGAEFHRYPHCDLEALRKMMGKDASPEKMIVSDTVFSMDGDIADVAETAKIATDSGATLYLDDAHATGVFGPRGEGLASGLIGDEAVVMGTFSKAMGSYGAYLACSKAMRDYFINRCSTFIYSTALPPGVYGAISAALKLVQTAEYREISRKLLADAEKLACEIRRIGFDTGGTRSPIIPVLVGDSSKVVRISQNLLEKGFLALPIRPPTVPEGTARLRISLNAAHTAEDVGKLLSALAGAK